MKHIITTVGTSVYTNFRKEEVKECLDKFREVTQITKEQFKELNKKEYFASRYKQLKDLDTFRKPEELIKKFWFKDTYAIEGGWDYQAGSNKPNLNASAEIKSICKIIEESKDTEFKIYLICSDTAICMSAGHLIKAFFEEIRPVLRNSEGNEATIQDIKICFIEKLQVDNADDFKDVAVMSLIEKIEVIAKGSQSEDIILNVSGGYKGVIPIMTIVGQLQGYELKYIYEDSEKLISLGKLPINFDLGYIENYVKYIVNPNLLNFSNQTIINQMFDLGLLKSKSLPSELTVIGELIKNKLNSDELPFEKTTMGYFVEYKLYEYYTLNKPEHYTKVTLGFRLSDDPNRELEDADLWFSNDNNTNVIAVEIKPISIKANAMRKKIRKNIAFTNQLNPPVLIKEFWIILYQFENNGLENEQVWCENVINQDIKSEFPSVIFRIKKITISQNIVDGDRNRIRYQEFMRSTIQNVDDIFSSIPNPITSQP
jgi:hypothetical protein